MRSETQLTPVAPIVLLAPDVIDGGLNFEYFFLFKANDHFKLGRVDIQRRAIAAPARWIMAPKLTSVLS